MATYAIGDVQGCMTTLERLLARVGFDPVRDRVWLTGDLVNRGPRSLDVLRWARDLGDRLVTVLGNHDVHLLGCAAGVRTPRRGDTLGEVLTAPDRDELLDWLRARPLVHREGDHVLVHAGLHPSWSIAEAEVAARALEAQLRGAGAAELLGQTDASFALAALTRLRTVRADGTMCLAYKGAPAGAPPGCVPWFRAPDRRSRDVTIVFGHWAALGFLAEPGLLALDTGCVWGETLTAVRLEDGARFEEPAAG